FAAAAHQTSDSFLLLEIEGARVTGQWHLALHDLEFAVGLDADEDLAITWGEVKARRAEIETYAAAHLRVALDGGPAAPGFEELLVDRLANGAYAVLRFTLPAAREPETVTLEYSAVFDLNPLHRGLFRITHRGEMHQGVFHPLDARREVRLDTPEPWREFAEFLREGVWHIWIGYDHILFLVALLLPAVLRRAAGRWEAVPSFRPALWNVVKVVTAFTVAHSVTLSLAALELVRLPGRPVEAVIALSVALAAANNLRPAVTERGWALAFGFGLIHGFGFASVLADLGLHPGSLARALVGFNLGVELGQLAIVAVFFPAAYALRRTAFYRLACLRGGSVLVLALALWWLWERLAG
ncbi:MAG TPA: HupE/UreJ family protein, partial [Verrucomicrobiota bacterium]|nr:HupE/UreJ family protein [Verrucomicrobiota bacterium]